MIKINRTGVFLQVRLNSSRMPGKALLNLSGKPLIAHVMDRLSVVPADVRAILTSNESEAVLRPIVDKTGWELFVGDSQNVLKRFVDAARFYEIDTVIRATGDNPLSSSEVAIETMNLFIGTDADLAYLKPIPYGSGVEVVKREALIRALDQTMIPYDLEHVTPYLYAHPNEFKIVTRKYYDDKVSREDIKVSVDTREDYERVNYFIKRLNEKKINMTMQSVVELWDELDFSKFRTILFVVTAGKKWGLGHLKRMFRLANFFSEDFRIFFSLKDEDEDALRLIHAEKHLYVPYENLDSITQVEGVFDRVITDVRDTTVREMEQYLKYGPVYSIDDLGGGGQLPFANIRMLPSLVNHKNFNFDGVSYLLLDPFLLKQERIRSGSARIKKILVTFGGSDPARLTQKILSALTGRGFEVTAVVGPFFNGKVIFPPDCEGVYSPDSLFSYIKDSDLVITSYGMTLMESLYLKRPVLVVNPSAYHDALTEAFQYPFFVKKEEGSKFCESVIENIAAIDKENQLGEKESRLTAFYQLNWGANIEKLVKVIKKSSPSIALCRSCSSLDVSIVSRSEKWNMYKCNSKGCGLFFMERLIDEKVSYDKNYFFDEYKKQYGKTYEEDREMIRILAGQRIKIIQKYLKSGKMLDFGAGLGFFAEYAKECGFDPVCCDISSSACEYIEKKVGIKAYCADQSYLEKQEEQFDVITSFYVLEHIKDFKKLLFLFSSHLRKNGVLALATPNGNGISIKKRWNEYKEKHPADHFFIFSPPILINELKRFGFKKIRIRITGIHPERIVKSKRLLKSKLFCSFIRIYANFLKLGDTFEIYAKKG